MNKDNQQQENNPEYDTKSASEHLEALSKLSPRDMESQNDKPRTINEQIIANKGKIQSKSISKFKKQPIDKKRLDESYTKIMSRIQGGLPTNNRFFSKIIHHKTIETISEVIGSTLARPNAILFGAIFAFVSSLTLYIIAKTIGYALSGSESIIAFGIGWLGGLMYDLLYFLVAGNKPE